jgi:predicted metal-dependent hydrolase
MVVITIDGDRKATMTALTADALRAALAADTADPKLNGYIATIKISTRRKTLGMSIAPGETGVTVTAPAHWTAEQAVEVLADNRYRIAKSLVRISHAVKPEHPVKELVAGEGFLLFGASNRLRLVDNPTVPVRHTDDHGKTVEPGTWRGRWIEYDRAARPLGARPLVDWYITEGDALAARHAAPIWLRITGGRRPMPTIRTADIGRRRWGSYHPGPNPDGDVIRLAWQLFQLPHRFALHILTHELVHASRPGGKPHGPQFWRAFERAEIGAKQTANEIDKAAATAWMGDVHTVAPATR